MVPAADKARNLLIRTLTMSLLSFTDVNECNSNVCGSGHCTNTLGDYSCSCGSGYSFQGGSCGGMNVLQLARYLLIYKVVERFLTGLFSFPINDSKGLNCWKRGV